LRPVDRAELRRWIEDALARYDRDVRERDETTENVTVDEIVDTVWGRLPLSVRRSTTRAQVQASLTMLTLRRGLAMTREDAGAAPEPLREVGGRAGHRSAVENDVELLVVEGDESGDGR
jgi:hypothetical protein